MRLKHDLDSVRRRAETKAAAHKTFTPEELVDRFPLFEDLSPEQREVLVLHFEPRTAQPGERIIRAGDKADTVYFVVDSKFAILSRRDFRQFLTRYPAIRDRIAALASERREMNRHLASENA